MRLRIAELARQKKGWNIKRVAQALDVEYQNVLLWNQGRAYPRLPMLLRLSRLFCCRIDTLLELTEKSTPTKKRPYPPRRKQTP